MLAAVARHNTYLGIIMVIDQCDQMHNGSYDCRANQFGRGKVHCRLVYANDPLVARTTCNFTGRCFAHDLNHPCHECTANASGSGGWRYVDEGGATGADFIPLGDVNVDPQKNAYDSHICFAAQSPVTVGDRERIYYMGGDGPHSGSRNSSFAMASVRRDGFAALAGDGTVLTVPIRCSGTQLTVTADFDSRSSMKHALQLGIHGDNVVGPGHAVPISTNGTNIVVQYVTGATFQAHVGQLVTMELRLSAARVYTVGWTNGTVGG